MSAWEWADFAFGMFVALNAASIVLCLIDFSRWLGKKMEI